MKKHTRILTLTLAAALALCCAAGCSQKSGTESSKPASSAASTEGEASDKTEGSEADESSEASEESAGEASIDVKNADYSSPSVTIEFGDFELIRTVTSDMQTGKYDGKVIKVTGISEKRMSSCSLMEKDEATGTGYGMTYFLDGKPDLSQYPEDDSKVEVLGVVTIDDYDVRVLTVLPENIKKVD